MGMTTDLSQTSQSGIAWFIYKDDIPFGRIVRMVIIAFGSIFTPLLTTVQFMVEYLKDTTPAENIGRIIRMSG